MRQEPTRTRLLWPSLLNGLLVLLVALAAYGQLLRPGWVPYSPHSDLVAYHYNTKTALWQSLQRGDGIPLWRADQFTGLPGLTHPQSQYTHPFAALFLLLPPAVATGPTIFLELLIGAFGFGVLGWELGLGRAGALLLTLCGLLQFKAQLATYAGWLGVLPTIALLPWTLAVALHALRRPGIPSVLAVAVVGALVLHGGQLQLPYYSFWLTLMLVGTTLFGMRRRGEAIGTAVGTLFAGGGLAVALSAYLLWPLVLDSSLITRSAASYEFFLAGHSLHLAQLQTFLFPEALGTPLNHSYPGDELWEDVGYFGILPLLLAISALVLGWRRPLVRPLALSALVTLGLSVDSIVLRLIWHVVPGFALFRCPSRLLFLTTFCGLALAGIGFDEIVRRLKGSGIPSATRRVATVILVLVTLEGVAYGRRYVTTAPAASVLPSSQVAARIATDHEAFRVAPLGRASVNPGWATLWGLELVTGFDSYNYKAYWPLFDLMANGHVREEDAPVWAALPGTPERLDLLNLLSVKYLVSQTPLPDPLDPSLKEVAHFTDEPLFALYRGLWRGDLYLYRNDRAFPLAWWASRVIGAPQQEGVLRRLRGAHAEGETFVAGSDEASPVSSGDGITVEKNLPGRLQARTLAKERRFLRWSELWHPGWSATVDGRPAEVIRADFAQLGLWIPAGPHEVALSFTPPGWATGCAATIVGLLVLVLLGLTAVSRTQRGRATPPGEDAPHGPSGVTRPSS